MAFVHGKNARLFLGAVDISSYLNGADFAADADVADTTTWGATWKTAVPGTVGAKLDVTGLYDGANGLPDVFLASLPVALTYFPGGGSGEARAMNAVDSAYAESSPVGGAVAIKATFMADQNGVSVGAALHALAKDTNTTTGSSVDGGAATTTGWSASLHVTAVDAGSWVVKLEDSANNSAWADVTSGAFTAATGATSEIIHGAAGATLRRYVRYTATRTGGTAGDGITFALAFSRN